jgi:hypothetical protein
MSVFRCCQIGGGWTGPMREHPRIPETRADGLSRQFLGLAGFKGCRGIVEPMRRYRAGWQDAEGDRNPTRVDRGCFEAFSGTSRASW